MKKTFKKITAVATTLALTLGMSLSAFAADSIDQFDSRPEATGIPASGNTYQGLAKGTDNKYTGSSTKDITVTTENASDTKVYRVDVEWDSLAFVYVFDATNSLWNPEEHTYGSDTDGAWKDDRDSAKITVRNHSNDAVWVTSAFGTGTDKTITTNEVTATLTPNATSAIATAVGTTFTNAPSEEITVSLTGKPNTSAAINVGTITITIKGDSTITDPTPTT